MLARTSSPWLALTLLLALWSAPAWAARRALLIANEAYAVRAARLGNPVKDAKKLAKALEGVGFTDLTVSRDLDGREMKAAINRFVESLGEGDEAFVYYSGHGLAIENVNYMLGVKFDESNPDDAVRFGDLYPVDHLVKRLEASPSRVRIVVVDACRNEPFSKKKGWRSRALDDDTFRGFEPVRRMPAGQGTLIAFATAGKSRALEAVRGIDGGPYAHALAELLPKPGLDVRLLFDDVRSRVRELTDDRQRPEKLSMLEGRYYFVPAKVRPPEAKPEPGPEVPAGMVKVPAGPFFMGCNEKVDSECFSDEKPGRTVNLPTFFIDQTEVTVNAYAACVRARRCSEPATGDYYNWGKSGRDEHPINGVNWEQATEYCAWKGHRLPTEPEWEKAARGTDGRKYAWGNAGYRQTKYANIADETAKRTFSYLTIAEGYEDGFVETAPVGSFPRGESPYGALDMIGNVWEWTSGWYSSERKHRVNRGGSWRFEPALARASYRNWNSPSYRGVSLGFRCARAAD